MPDSRNEPPDTFAVRAEEMLDLDALRVHLDASGFRKGAPLALEQFPGGHSNLTYLLRCGDEEFVLRRPPLGPVAPKAHDMVREARLLAALNPVYARAPRIEWICEDAAVIGAPFYLMQRRRGAVIRREEPAILSGNPALRASAAAAFLEALTDLHAVDVSAPALAALGRPQGFLERQLKGWADRWQRARTSDSPAMERILAYLAAHLPPETAASVFLHNDYKLDNVVLAFDPDPRVEAVLDWEMSALGDPLIDLGILLCYWPEAADPPQRREAISPVTTLPGWPSREELIHRYARTTGRDVTHAAYYETFAMFKLTVVLQQIFYRYHVGQTSDARFAALEGRVRDLIDLAAARTGAGGSAR